MKARETPGYRLACEILDAPAPDFPEYPWLTEFGRRRLSALRRGASEYQWNRALADRAREQAERLYAAARAAR